jgi:hypothetical protein
MAQAPQPTYERDIATLVRYFRQSLAEIEAELMRVDLTDFRRANAVAVQRQIRQILDNLDEKTMAWVEAKIPEATEDGIVNSIMALGVTETVEEAKKVASFNQLNRTLIETAVADTQADLLQVTQNVERKTRTAIRQAMAEAMRSNITQGVNGARTIKRDFLAEARKTLGDSINTGIIDASNRRWRPEVYAEMVTRTKLHATYREATQNDAIGRGAYYGVISRHGAVDACKNWEGRIIKLTPDAPGSYPYIANLPRNEIFHPNCKHHISPVRNPERV